MSQAFPVVGDVRSMRAAILAESRQPLVVDQVELPETLDVGQVFVRVVQSGICGSQLGEIGGNKGVDRYVPHLLGHEAGGVVWQVGPGVRRVKPGDHVVLHWRKAAGIDAAPPSYRWRGQKLNAGWVTTFNEYAVVSENRVTPVPAELDLGLAAMFGCPVTTGLGVAARDANLQMGQSVVILGAGGVGLSIVQGAALHSATPIVAVDLIDAKLELARKLGATHTINSKGMDIAELAQRLRAIVGPVGADAVIENTGDVGMIRLAYELAAAQGVCVLVGVPRFDRDATLHTLPLHFGKRLTGSHGGDAQPDLDIPRYLKLHEAGKLDLASLITHRYDLASINQALDDMRQGVVTGRCLVAM